VPPTRELARQLSVSRTTVTVAYDRLVGEGFLTARVGAGTYVSNGLAGVAHRSRRAGGTASTPPRRGSSWATAPFPPTASTRGSNGCTAASAD
jgi:GntR family transcriptional regulator/MocR family aminotransferase